MKCILYVKLTHHALRLYQMYVCLYLKELFVKEIENNLCKIKNNGNWQSGGHKVLTKSQSWTEKSSGDNFFYLNWIPVAI